MISSIKKFLKHISWFLTRFMQTKKSSFLFWSCCSRRSSSRFKKPSHKSCISTFSTSSCTASFLMKRSKILQKSSLLPLCHYKSVFFCRFLLHFLISIFNLKSKKTDISIFVVFYDLFLYKIIINMIIFFIRSSVLSQYLSQYTDYQFTHPHPHPCNVK